eukprot:CAMPEP_0172802762 /NCGR_PEP_ID=MMETSP1075-20121228/4081_1 /TAXON_ID=2916 /ORGANISM="Ceratium fusus, Strain PA161109" /LENGTH=130 /DNA_ID=CAMNT_0013641077 /DNA_START=698 /DNA_END=1088 /DNA_ORIENTATION=-
MATASWGAQCCPTAGSSGISQKRRPCAKCCHSRQWVQFLDNSRACLPHVCDELAWIAVALAKAASGADVHEAFLFSWPIVAPRAALIDKKWGNEAAPSKRCATGIFTRDHHGAPTRALVAATRVRQPPSS